MISILMGAMPLSMVAQDDLYFVPKKKSAEVVKVYTPVNNRMESQYEVIQNDSTNDIIDFDGQKGIYPDSLTEDFALTKKMQRFEDYELSDNAAFWAGYHLGRDTWDWGWTWHSPWYYRTYGWYGGWYDPWYYTSWRYGWYDPWLVLWLLRLVRSLVLWLLWHIWPLALWLLWLLRLWLSLLYNGLLWRCSPSLRR